MIHTAYRSFSRRTLLLAATLVAVLVPASAFAAPAVGPKVQWMINFPGAQVRAKQQKKYILAYFSGSGWDAWGAKLEKEVLHTQMFVDWVNKNVIPFQVDTPKEPKANDLYKRQNQDLKTKYQIAIVPTFLLIDGDGEVVARAFYRNLELKDWEKPGQPLSAIDFLDGMVKNKGAYEQLLSYGSLESALQNARDHKLPMLLLVTDATKKDPMLLEAEKLVQSQRFVRWVNVNTSFYQMTAPAAGDASPEAAIYRGLATKYKFGNTAAQLLLFSPNEETTRWRTTQWNVLQQMDSLMMNLQKNLPMIEYLGTTWLTDLRQAKAIVSQQPKRVLFLYFAEDNEYCKKFESEILDTEEFTGWPFHHLVLVKFDFTKDKKRPPALDVQNEEQANLYAVRGYPFVVLVNNKGQKIGEAKYQRGGAKPFIDELKRIYQSDVDRRMLTPADVETPVPAKND
jgi:thioredoxin-related protein